LLIFFSSPVLILVSSQKYRFSELFGVLYAEDMNFPLWQFVKINDLK